MKTILKNWEICIECGQSPVAHLHGVVSGHPKIPDGHSVTTSEIKTINFVKKIAKTQNTTYHLED